MYMLYNTKKPIVPFRRSGRARRPPGKLAQSKEIKIPVVDIKGKATRKRK